MKRKLLLYFIAFALGLFIGYKALITFYPSLVFTIAKSKIKGVENAFIHSALPDEKSRFVVKPNPDFLYSSCFYKLENGPLLITGLVDSPSYWSVAFYRTNTENYYLKNDEKFDTDSLKLFIVSPKQKNVQTPKGYERIQSPDEKGLVLFRFLVSNSKESNLLKIKTAQKNIVVKTLFE